MDIPKPMQAAAYIYLSMPIVIFLTGWVKFYIAAPLCILIIFAIYRMVTNTAPEPCTPEVNKSEQHHIKNDLWKYVIVFIIILFWVSISGIGKLSYQNGDHVSRNGMFELLVDSKWPVILDSPHYEKPVGMIYYLGYWMPSALVGKLFGIDIGYFAQALWAAIGIFLFYYIITKKYVKKAALWPLVIIIFFSGLDILGKYLMGENIQYIFSNNTDHIEWWIGFPFLQYSSMTTQLFWVFNQALPAWLCTVVLIAQKNNRYVAFLLALCMLHGVFPAIGMVILILFMVGQNIASTINKKTFMAFLRDFIVEHLTFENCIGVVLALIFTVYFAGNFVSQNGTFRSWTNFISLFATTLLFFIIEAGVYLAVVASEHKRNYLFYYVIAVLLFICPWYIVGIYNDFCMRVSIPALVILMCLVIDTLAKAIESNKRKLIAAIICLLFIGSATPLHEIVRSISATVETEQYGEPQGIFSLNPLEDETFRDQFYGYSDNTFFTYLGK